MDCGYSRVDLGRGILRFARHMHFDTYTACNSCNLVSYLTSDWEKALEMNTFSLFLFSSIPNQKITERANGEEDRVNENG